MKIETMLKMVRTSNEWALDFSGFKLNIHDLNALLRELNKNPTVKFLTLQNCRLDDEQAKNLMQLKYVLDVDLSCNLVSSSVDAQIRSKLAFNEISPKANSSDKHPNPKAIDEGQSLANNRQLVLNEGMLQPIMKSPRYPYEINPQQFNILLEHIKESTHHVLNLSNNHFKPHELATIIEALNKNESIEHINMLHCDLDDELALKLLRLKFVHDCDLTFNNISEYTDVKIKNFLTLNKNRQQSLKLINELNDNQMIVEALTLAKNKSVI